MNNQMIYITEQDAKRLSDLIRDPNLKHPDPDSLLSLKQELSRAQIVAPEEIPHDVVTMNSTIKLLDLDTGEEEIYTLVFPSDADVDEGKISILAPIGTAILGYKVGDEFTWNVPDGERRLQIKEIVYQPEASGDFHL